MLSDADDDYQTDCIFLNRAARVAFVKFIGSVPDTDHKTSVKWVARANAWTTCASQSTSNADLKKLTQKVPEPHVQKTRYNALLSVATGKL